MKKLKGFYKNNRIFVILMGVAIFCIAIIASAFLYLVLTQNQGNLYGNRLNGIETVEISKTRLTELETTIKEDSKVAKVTCKIKGKIIYINIYLNEGKATDAKNIAIKSLEFFTDDEKSFYDISYIVSKDDIEDVTFPIMGYKKSDNTIISWTNYSE